MGKRRTRKQKEKARHRFFLEKNLDEAKNIDFEPVVKGQFKNTKKGFTGKKGVRKNAVPTAKEKYQSYIRKDIIKSLIVVSLVLALELMIYLVWR